MNYKKIGKFLMKLGISLLFVAWLVMKINWKEVLMYTQRISVWQIVLYVVVLLLGMVVSSYKWKILAEHKGFKFPLEKYFQFYLAGTFLNNFFPSFIGGDTYRAFQIGKEEKRYTAATATVVMDRVTGMIGGMVVSIFFAILNWRVVLEHKILLIILIASIGILIGVAILGLLTKMEFWKNFSKYIPKKIQEVIKDFADYQGSVELKKALFASLFYNLIGLGLVNYVLFWALGIDIGVLNYLTVIFLISIVSSIPVSVNNIGIKEWAYVTFFGFFGVASSAVVTVALVSRIIQMVVSFAALPGYLKNKK
jgi:uncharacterized protein (TIRG00374 family)